jgi:DNA mismatch endonuclease, patch repair protein
MMGSMADVFTREQRSAIMRRVRSTDTAPELRVRGLAHRMGYRFRLHRKDLPGRPDLVFAGRRIALFVNGCYWHGHRGCAAASMPRSNIAYWKRKFARNRVRDRAAARELVRLGWRAEVIWECETRDEAALKRRLRRMLGAPATILAAPRFARIARASPRKMMSVRSTMGKRPVGTRRR